MKKSITIPKIEEDLYNSIKAKAEEQQLSVSDFVSALFEEKLNEETDEKNKEISEENKELLERIKELENKEFSIKLGEETYTGTQEYIDSICADVHHLFLAKVNEIESLKKQLSATEEENNSLLKINPNEIKVKFDDLETKLIYYVAEKESKRTGKEVTPADLLRAMFVNYSVKGEMWFFNQPTRREINQLREELKSTDNE